MIILAVDYGDVRTGTAICDRLELLASPLGTITQRNSELLAAELAELAASHKATEIVMGLPRNMDGSEGFRAAECRAFGQILSQLSSLPVVFRDERLTTVSAHGFLNQTDTRGKKRKQIVDTVSAVIILQDHIAARRAKGLGLDAPTA